MDQPRRDEHQEASGVSAYSSIQGTEDQVMGKLAEAQIPPLSPRTPPMMSSEVGPT